VVYKPYNVVKTIINNPPVITINRWYKPFPNGWFMIVLPTLEPIYFTGRYNPYTHETLEISCSTQVMALVEPNRIASDKYFVPHEARLLLGKMWIFPSSNNWDWEELLDPYIFILNTVYPRNIPKPCFVFFLGAMNSHI